MVARKTERSKRLGKSVYKNRRVFSGESLREKTGITFSYSSIKYTFYILCLAALIYLFFLSPLFAVSEVIVEGVANVSKDELSNTIPKGKNIFLLKSRLLEEGILAGFPEIESVQIYRGIPNAIKIVVSERDSKLVWQSGEHKYLISSRGEITKETGLSTTSELPLVVDKQNIPVVLGSQLVSPNFVAFVNNIYSTFFTEINIKSLNFEVSETTFDINLITDAGFYVKLNTMRSSKKQLENLKLVLDAKRQDIHEYVDLRVDGWAYYK